VSRATLAAIVVALLLAGCGVFVAPAQPTAGELTEIVGSLVRRNMTITTQVAGDPGCRESALHSNAIRYDVRPARSDRSYPVYVFGWKSQQTFDTDKATFDACVKSYRDSTGTEVETIEHSPWRAYGPEWPSELLDAVDAALVEAGGAPASLGPE
jgi:hypothetical protein